MAFSRLRCHPYQRLAAYFYLYFLRAIFAVSINLADMKQNTKDWIQYISAVALIASAIVLVFTSFLTIERVGEGVNAYVGIAVSGGLAIFGVAAYFVNQVAQFKTEIRKELKTIKEEEQHEERQYHHRPGNAASEA